MQNAKDIVLSLKTVPSEMSEAVLGLTHFVKSSLD